MLKPSFAELGLSLETFVVENISLPDELQKMLDQRIGMNMIGDMGKYTQFQVAQSHAHRSRERRRWRAAGIGVGLGAGLTMAQSMMNAMKHWPDDARGGPAAPRSSCARRASCACDGNEVLHQLWQADSASIEVLSGVRHCAAIIDERQNMNGLEWIVEAHGCDPAALAEQDRLEELFRSIVAAMDLHHSAKPAGISFPIPAASPE